MENRFTQYHRLLNREGAYPGVYLRRNHIMYPLVCAVNNIICLYLSDNYEPISLFICRAYKHIVRYSDDEKGQGNEILPPKYKKLVLAYLSEMANFLLTQDENLDKHEFIPKELL